MNQKLLTILSTFLFTGCSLLFPSKPQESSRYIVESVETARLVILRDQKSGDIYKLLLACLDETNGEESRRFLMEKLRVARDISIYSASKDIFEVTNRVKAKSTTKRTYKVTGALGVRPWGFATYWENVNAKMVQAGMATLDKNANEETCDSFNYLKDMQVEAQKSKAGLWAKPKQ